MNKFRLVLAGLCIFLAGLVAGVAGTTVYHNARLSALVRMEHGPVDFFVERLSRLLDLSDQQKEAIRPIVEDVIRSVQEARRPCLTAEEDAFRQGRERISAQLNPEQAKKFNDFMERAKERRRRFFGHP